MELSQERKAKLSVLENALGVKFNNIALLNQALTHTSYANEFKGAISHNERLEFLGDAVLELASSTYLFKHFHQMPEGELTKARASVVCETSLAKLARKLHVGDYLLLGRGERMTGGENRPSILADAFESIIGAIYMDQGWSTAYDYVLNKLHEEFIAVEHGYNLKDYKTILQEVVQGKGQQAEYKMISEEGPDHAKVFEFAVKVNGNIDGIGKGTTKKEAEQHAAWEALKKYGIEK
ncbi:MAG TPA: ribonuclease III [Megamonas hypermegale]|uniref:Ribonuclease 3 n=1 Tax=Megamonas hypermegale TaxID=158847 RepID=A0A921HL77_9FIRM|nr:ribonuclease III [Megamonas hypermegale]MDM8142713.1 ribonuclease III [Megamonas hypermegale]HJF84487.1 ribonuclease III [Megamonas hypermegale]